MTTIDADDRALLPLNGLHVVDFSRLLPGPWASQMLAEFGKNPRYATYLVLD